VKVGSLVIYCRAAAGRLDVHPQHDDPQRIGTIIALRWLGADVERKKHPYWADVRFADKIHTLVTCAISNLVVVSQ
jgi:hypothetical protein